VKNAQCGLRGGGLEGKLTCFSALCDVRSVWAWLGSKNIYKEQIKLRVMIKGQTKSNAALINTLRHDSSRRKAGRPALPFAFNATSSEKRGEF